LYESAIAQSGYEGADENFYQAGDLIATSDTVSIPIVDLVAFIESANPPTGDGGNTTPTTPNLTAFDELVDEDLNNSASEDADGITWNTEGHNILEGLLVAPVGGAAPTPVALTNPDGVSVTDGTYTLTILESSANAGAIESIKVSVNGSNIVIASATNVLQTMDYLVTEFPQLNVVSSGSGGGTQTDSPASVTHNYDVTVVSSGGSNVYLLNGIEGLQIFPEDGHTYVFDLSDSSLSTHPFALSATVRGEWNAGTKYETGIVEDTVNKTLTLEADANTPAVLYYYCEEHDGMGNDVLAPLFTTNEIAIDASREPTDFDAVDFNYVIADYLHNSDNNEVALTENVDVTSVTFEIPLEDFADVHSDFAAAVDSVITGWSTTDGFLRLNVQGEKLLEIVDDGDDRFFGGSEEITQYTLSAVLNVNGTENSETLFHGVFGPAVDAAAIYDLTSGTPGLITDPDAISAAKLYLELPEMGILGVLGNGEFPDDVTHAHLDTMNVEFSSLNTDYSDDTQEAVTLDSWGGQTLNIRAYLTDLELVDDSAIATKIIDANDSNLWTGVKVTKHDFQMVMTFDAAIDAALENIDSTNTVVVDTIEIYNNTGTRAAPVYDQKIAEQTGGSVKYFEYINNFGLLDPTTSSATAEAQVQEGSMFSLVAVSESVFDLDTINTKILPDFLSRSGRGG
jgi:hypothetical protein